MSELTHETVQAILIDMRQDAITVQQKLDMLYQTNATLDYRDLDMLHYVIKVMESRIRILRGYDR